jgi:hypothetical protein
MVRLEELGKLEKFNDLNGTQTCDLPACSTVPQPPGLLTSTAFNSRFIAISQILQFTTTHTYSSQLCLHQSSGNNFQW